MDVGVGRTDFLLASDERASIPVCVQLLCTQAARLLPPHHIRTPRPQQRTDQDRSTALDTDPNTTRLGQRTVRCRSRRPEKDMGQDTVECDACEAACTSSTTASFDIGPFE